MIVSPVSHAHYIWMRAYCTRRADWSAMHALWPVACMDLRQALLRHKISRGPNALP